MVTPLSSVRYPSYFASQLSLFGVGGAGGNGFGAGVRVRVGGGGEDVGLLEIIQAMHMDQSPFYASLDFGGGGR